MESFIQSVFLLALIALGVVGYLAPSWIALRSGHHQLGPIMIINLLLGWTLVGWVLVMAWSTSWIRRPA